MALPTLRQTFQKEILGRNLIFLSVVSFLYFSFSVLLINYKLVFTIIFGEYDLFYKVSIIQKLIAGSLTALGFSDFLLLIITSFLVSVNLLLLIRILSSLRKSNGKLSLTVGGSTVLGVLVAGGCSCGFSVLSILGLAGVVSFIPFGGLLIHLFVIALLLFSLWYSLKTYHLEVACRIK